MDQYPGRIPQMLNDSAKAVRDAVDMMAIEGHPPVYFFFFRYSDSDSHLASFSRVSSLRSARRPLAKPSP